MNNKTWSRDPIRKCSLLHEVCEIKKGCYKPDMVNTCIKQVKVST